MSRKNYLWAVAGLALGLFIPSTGAAENRLSLTGVVDRVQVKRGETVNVAIVVGNPGEKSVTDCELQIVAGGAARNFGNFSLGPLQEHPETCSLVLENEGQIQVVALVSWTEGGITKATALPLSQVNVSASDWVGRQQIQVYWGPVAVVALALILLAAWRLGRSPRPGSPRLRWALIVVVLLLASLALLARGLFYSAPLVMSGVVLLLVGLLLWLLGEKETKRLFARLRKAGPLEFLAAQQRREHYEAQVFKDREFKRPEVRLEYVDIGPTLDSYLHLYRLRAYSVEARLIAYDPPVPVLGAWGRSWLDYLPKPKEGWLGEDLPSLKRLHTTIKAYEELRSLLNQKISNIIKEALKNPAERDTKVRDAIALIDEYKRALIDEYKKRAASSTDSCVPPHCFTVKADLQMAINDKEAALATLYEGQSHHPDSSVVNYNLAFYLSDLVGDHYTAVIYGDKALAALCDMEDQLRNSYRTVDRMVRDAPVGALAAYLKEKLVIYRNGLRKELQTWLKESSYAVKNLIAYAITQGELVPRSDDAYGYAKAAVDAFPKNALYLDTLGFARLKFGSLNRDRSAVAESVRILGKAVYYSDRSSPEPYSEPYKEAIRQHRKQACEAIAQAKEWDTEETDSQLPTT
jgi:hypothetical protein